MAVRTLTCKFRTLLNASVGEGLTCYLFKETWDNTSTAVIVTSTTSQATDANGDCSFTNVVPSTDGGQSSRYRVSLRDSDGIEIFNQDFSMPDADSSLFDLLPAGDLDTSRVPIYVDSSPSPTGTWDFTNATVLGIASDLESVLAIGNTSGAYNIAINAGQLLQVDTINETTAAAGVTIDSVLLKDGLVSGRNVATDGAKLDGIEAGAEVNYTSGEIEAITNHDNLLGFVADEHIAHTGVTLTAGAGLTGGGDISASRTFAVGAGTGVTVNADDIAIGQDVAASAAPTFAGITLTDALVVPNGTEAAPSIRGSDDNSGIYFLSGLYPAFIVNGVETFRTAANNVSIPGTYEFRWSLSADAGSAHDLKLARDFAGVLAQRNGANPQEMRIYGTYTDASNYERVSVRHDGVAGYIDTQSAGTGYYGNLNLAVGGNVKLFATDAYVATTVDLIPNSNGIQDFGLTGNRWSALFAGGNTVTASSPMLDLAQTWNDGAETFTGAVMNITDTASASDSLLQDWQVGGSSKASITKTGNIFAGANSGFYTGGVFMYLGTGTPTVSTAYVGVTSTGLRLRDTGSIQWSSTTNVGSTPDLSLTRDSANTLAQRDGTNAQEFRIYGTYTDASNYERMELFHTGATMGVNTTSAGTGLTVDFQIQVDGAEIAKYRTSQIEFTKSVFPTATIDFGRNANRWRQGYFGGTSAIGGSVPALDIAQTWNNGAVTFTGAVMNIIDTASASDSLFLDLQVGGSSTFSVDKNGFVTVPTSADAVGYGFSNGKGFAADVNGYITINSGPSEYISFNMGASGDIGALELIQSAFLGWSANNAPRGNSDLKLYRDASGVLALRNGTNAQEFRVYNTYTDASNYELASMGFVSNEFVIETEGAGTGSSRPMSINPAGTLYLGGQGASKAFLINSNGLAPNNGGVYRLGFTSQRLTSGYFGGNTITASTPMLDIAQTWNNAAETFTGAVMNITDTASASNSLLMDLQVGGQSKLGLRKDAVMILPIQSSIAFSNSTNGQVGTHGITLFYDGAAVDNSVLQIRRTGQTTNLYGFGYSGLNLGSSTLGFGPNTVTVNQDVKLVRDAAGILAQRNSTNAQEFRIYGTYTDASNYERLSISHNGSSAVIDSQAAGTGTATELSFRVGGSTKFYADNNGISFVGDILSNNINTWDIGSAAAPFARAYLGTSLVLDESANIVAGTTTGTKIGTATTQKLGFFNATPVVQQSHIADVSGTPSGSNSAIISDLITAVNALIAVNENLGLTANS